MSQKEEKQFLLDVRRSILLGAYIHYWGIPEERTISKRGDDRVEVYSFPPKTDGKVYRFATVGLSGFTRQDGMLAQCELFMALPKDLGGASTRQVVSFILDLAAYSQRKDVRFQIGATIPESPRIPESWPTRALILDEPRGEPEELAHFHLGSECIHLIWIAPIYKEEYELIHKEGIETFYNLEEQSEWSLADPHRPPLIDDQNAK